MARDSSGPDGPGERPRPGLSRRRLLRLSGAGLAASLAGCNDPTGSTTEDRPIDAPTTVADPTATPTTPANPTATRSPTATSSPTPAATAADRLGRSPGSHVGPGDGFADVSWFAETDLRVLRVTTLDAEGEGSLRWALEQPGPRLVVFEVGGVVDLDERHLQVDDGRLWVAGQTAPPPGITVVRGSLQVDADDCVVQHLRVRPGDAGNERDWEPDAINTGHGTSNNVIDHCTASWSVDEALSVGYRSSNTTVSNCLIAEALHDASHSKGEHGYGSLVGDGAEDVTLAGNLWAHNTARNPRLKAETTSVVANNVMYHFDRGVVLDDSTVAAIHGNAFLRLDDRRPNIDGGRASVSDNFSTPGVPMTENVHTIGMRPFWPQRLETVPSDEVVDRVLGSVGPRPAERSPADEHVLATVRAGTGRYVDSQAEVGGYPELDSTERPLDVPEQGLAEWLYRHTEAVELADSGPP